MKELFLKIKRFVRKKYIIYQYNRYGLVYLKSTDRQFGLSTILMKESIKHNIPIYVPTINSKIHIAHEMFMLGQLGFAASVTEQYALEHLIIAPSDITRGKRFDCVLIDNQCSDSDVDKLTHYLGYGTKLRGFITIFDDKI